MHARRSLKIVILVLLATPTPLLAQAVGAISENLTVFYDTGDGTLQNTPSSWSMDAQSGLWDTVLPVTLRQFNGPNDAEITGFSMTIQAEYPDPSLWSPPVAYFSGSAEVTRSPGLLALGAEFYQVESQPPPVLPGLETFQWGVV